MEWEPFEQYEAFAVADQSEFQRQLKNGELRGRKLKAMAVRIHGGSEGTLREELLKADPQELPFLRIGILEEEADLPALQTAALMHVRIARKHVRYRGTYSDLQVLNRSGILLKHAEKEGGRRPDEPLTETLLLESGYLSRVFEGEEKEPLFQWVQEHILCREAEQIQAIRMCFERYLWLYEKTSDRGLLLQEENRQFCLMAERALEKRSSGK